jgi:hypothetical protein
MFPPQAGTNEFGDIHIPFAYSADSIPFARWLMVTEKIWQSDGPVSIQSVIITHNGEVFVQYAKEINSKDEYPKERTAEHRIEAKTHNIKRSLIDEGQTFWLDNPSQQNEQTMDTDN